MVITSERTGKEEVEFYALIIATLEYLLAYSDEDDTEILSAHLKTAERKLYNAQQKERYEKRKTKAEN